MVIYNVKLYHKIPDIFYSITPATYINELCHHLNTNFQHVFPKMVSRYDVKKWIKNKELITLNVSDNIPEELIHLKAVEDFLFRLEKGYLCNYESVKYYKACEISSEFNKSLLETILE